MRIAYVLNSLGMGGAEKEALAVAERMSKRGHGVTVIALQPRAAEEWPTALRVVHLGMQRSPASFLAGVARAHRLVREFKPDLLHSHSFHANLFARLLKVVVSSIRVVSTIHNVYEGGRLRMLGYRLSDPLSTRTVAVSRAAADRFVRIRAISKRKCLVIANGIDLSEFSPDTKRRAAMRSAMRAESCFIWFVAGRIVPAKDYSNLLEAFARVLKECSEAELWIAGALPDARVIGQKHGKTGFAWASVMDKGMHDHVRWLGLRRDIPALLDAADAFVLSSAWEGMPLAVGEAMAMKKPVVATDAGGVRELVGDVGVLVPVRNHEALAQAMMGTMRRSTEERAQLGRAGRQRIADHFSLDAAVDAWETLYQGISGQ